MERKGFVWVLTLAVLALPVLVAGCPKRLTADFQADPVSGMNPLTVQFTDLSESNDGDIATWLWSFGDGATSADPSPAHVYQTPGTYTVSLTITREDREDTRTRENLITVDQRPLTADFEATPTIGLAPLDVQFTDTSFSGPGAITAWAWSFGDGESSVEQHPEHTFVAPGAYTVSLTVTSGGEESTATQTAAVTVVASPTPVASVPKGWFQMGAQDDDPDADDAMLPAHFVYLDEYQIGMFEVTGQEFSDTLNWALARGRIDPTGQQVNTGGQLVLALASATCPIGFADGSFSPKERDGRSMADYPVVEVTWYGAVAFCNWLSEQAGLPVCYDLSTWTRIEPVPKGFRLPTEAEWERAAAWDDTREDVICPEWYTGYSWLYAFRANLIDRTRCNYTNTNPAGLSVVPFTSLVGLFSGTVEGAVDSRSPVGCYDMSGNVWEWCHDRMLDYTASNQVNPVGGSDDAWRIWRGGSWASEAAQCRAAYRSWNLPEEHNDKLGFRVARSVR